MTWPVWARPSRVGWVLLHLAVLAWLLLLLAHSTPTRAQRLVAWLEDTWDRTCLSEAINCWHWAEDDHGGYYLKPRHSPRLWIQVCIPDPAPGRVWISQDRRRLVQAAQRGACDVDAWWATRLWPEV